MGDINTSICPHCGHSKLDTSPSKHTTPGDIAFIHAETQRLDALIEQLTTRRAALLRKLNYTQSVTYSLPPELLSTIFQYAFPPPSFKPRIQLESLEADDPVSPRTTHDVLPDPPAREERVATPIALGAVSSYWRQVAWSTPQLWSSLDLRPTNSGTVARSVTLLQLYAQNAGSAGLHLQVVFHWGVVLGRSDDAFAELAQPLTDVLFSTELVPRIRTLVLSNPPVAWMSQLTTGFENLETFALVTTVPALEMTDIVLSNVPALRRVSLRGLKGEVVLPSSTIHTLTLREMPIDRMVQLLLSSPNLVDYYAIDCERARATRSTTWLLSNDFSLEHLERFEWSGLYDRWTRKLLQHLRLPSLTYLHLNEDLPTFEPDIMNFFTHLPPSMTTLHLSRFWDYTTLSDLFTHLPQVQKLILDNCEYEVIPEVLELLTPSYSELPQTPFIQLSNRHLPNLRVLAIENTTFANSNMDGFPEAVSDAIAEVMVMRTCMRPDTGFRLEVTPAHVKWTPKVKDELREVVRSGVLLQVLENGSFVDWL